MKVPVVSTAHAPENYRELLPDVCSVVAQYDCGDFILLKSEWRDHCHADLLPVLDWFVGAYGVDKWLRLDADGCELEGVKNFWALSEIEEREKLEFINAYKTALLWSSGDGEQNESFEDFELSAEAVALCEADCRAFIEVAAPLLAQYVDQIKCPPDCTPWAMAGHDFWLTRAGHGVGFWDRGLDELGDQLTALCGHGTQFPNRDAYLGDDNLVNLL